MTEDFYKDIAAKVGFEKDDAILTICAGPYDRDTFFGLGFSNVTVSNLEHHGHTVSDYSPYKWERQDAENLSAPDGSFDWVVVHAGLHHCGSPHRALCEMLRVARKGILVIESKDSHLMRVAAYFGLTDSYELEPIALSGASATSSFGGFRNGYLPNYVYRWTEREVLKTVASFVPERVPTVKFFYGLRLPMQRIAISKSLFARIAVRILSAVGRILELVAPKQGNEFGFAVYKEGPLQPWLTESVEGIQINKAFFNSRFSPEKYRI